MKKTLVIHPSDPTTDCLSVIYSDKAWSVLTQPQRQYLPPLIKEHDRIVMLGHGCAMGLFDFYSKHFNPDWLIVDETLAPLLKRKECAAIWCYANGYFNSHKLKGFHTGMIISETGEARIFLHDGFTKEHVEESNTLLADSVRKYIFKPDMLERLRKDYVQPDNPVITYNRNNLFLN